MEFSEDADVRAKRWNGLTAVAKSPSAATLEALTRLAFRTKLQNMSGEASQLREQLAANGPPLGDEELALMAASALALVLKPMDTASAKAASLITGAACAGLRCLKQPMDLVGMAKNVQTHLAETSRRRPALEQQRLVSPQLDIQASLNALEEGNVATVRAAIDALASASLKALAAIASRQRQFESAVQGYVCVQDEELDILWWLQGERCLIFGVAFGDVPVDHRAIAFAVELAALTKVLPGPTALSSLLNRAGVDDTVQLTIPEAIQGIPKDWLARLVPDERATKVSVVTTPILEATRRRQEVDGEDTWIAAWSSVTGLDQATKLPALRLAESLYCELLQVSLG
ncbi:MAG: hypothetical protein IPN40_01530 [Uliginosibacterium sp.]|nr:hypothetical protein [Uliginosibacterium sp.]